MTSAPVSGIFTVMLRPRGAASYVEAGRLTFEGAPGRGAEIDIAIAGRAARGVIDEVFIPPGCEEHCIGTIFASEI